MSDVRNAFAKLAGVLVAAKAFLAQDDGSFHNPRPKSQFAIRDAEPDFLQAQRQVAVLRQQLPELYGDFPEIDVIPGLALATQPPRSCYGRNQFENLIRVVNQIFEIRSNSELSAPRSVAEARVFISHGRASDWREVQGFIERDLNIKTLELAQEPNLGRTVLAKLHEESARCNFAVIVMTGDDVDAEGVSRARENVVHEIGYLQGRYGLSAVCLLHEEGTNIPSNIGGLVYVPFTKGNVAAAFALLMRELKAYYKT